MDFEQSKQISDEIESALSEVLPDLNQLLQHYQISKTLEISLASAFLDTANMAACTCCLIRNRWLCAPMYQPHSSSGVELGLEDPEETQQFCADLESKLSTVLPRLRQSADQTDEDFEVLFLIDPASGNPAQSAVCKWVDGVLQCSNS